MTKIHTIVVSRHYEHEDNVPTANWLREVKENTDKIRQDIPTQVVNTNVIGTDKARTGGTAKEIASNLQVPVDAEKVLDWLSYQPVWWPLKEEYVKLWKYYEEDTDVKKQGYSDAFVDRMQHNQFEGVDFDKIAAFNTKKFYQTIVHILRNTEKSNFTIAGIHGGYFWESIIYALRGDAMPSQRQGQIKMWENFILNIIQDDVWEPELSVEYRWVKQNITLEKIKNTVNDLRTKLV